jgi:hypothetical protein
MCILYLMRVCVHKRMYIFLPGAFAHFNTHTNTSTNTTQTIASYYDPAWNLLRSRMKVLHFAGDSSSKPWSFSGAVSPSLGAYVYLWQSIARFVYVSHVLLACVLVG